MQELLELITTGAYFPALALALVLMTYALRRAGVDTMLARMLETTDARWLRPWIPMALASLSFAIAAATGAMDTAHAAAQSLAAAVTAMAGHDAGQAVLALLRAVLGPTAGAAWPGAGGEHEELLVQREPNNPRDATGRPAPLRMVPSAARYVTAGVDITSGFFEYEVIAWGGDGRSWNVDDGTIEGDTKSESTWRKLDDLLVRAYPSKSGARSIDQIGIDSGYQTRQALAWAQREPSRVLACKGVIAGGRSDAHDLALAAAISLGMDVLGPPYLKQDVIQRRMQVADHVAATIASQKRRDTTPRPEGDQ